MTTGMQVRGSEAAASAPSPVSLGELFRTFLVIGATSFGGGVVAYLRENLVTGRRWLDDQEFLAALEISQTLPGLNATNMSIIVGEKLCGVPGAIIAFLGMTLADRVGMHGEGVCVDGDEQRAAVNLSVND